MCPDTPRAPASTRAAWRAVAHAGLDAEMPLVSLLGFAEFSERAPDAFSRQAWERTQCWLEQANEDATRLLREHWSLVEYLTEILLEQSSLDGPEFVSLVNGFGASPVKAFDAVPLPLPEENRR